MPTSGTCRRSEGDALLCLEGAKPGCLPPPACGGFTLIEILVVLVVVGLLAGIAIPNLQKVVQRIEISSQRQAVIGELAGLGYRAYVTGQPISLGKKAGNSRPGENDPLHLPDRWQIDIPQPILYTFNGACSGGTVILTAPDNRQEIFQLKPPRCDVVPAAGS